MGGGDSKSTPAPDEDRNYVSPVAQGEVIDAAEKKKNDPTRVYGVGYDRSNYAASSASVPEESNEKPKSLDPTLIG